MNVCQTSDSGKAVCGAVQQPSPKLPTLSSKTVVFLPFLLLLILLLLSWAAKPNPKASTHITDKRKLKSNKDTLRYCVQTGRKKNILDANN